MGHLKIITTSEKTKDIDPGTICINNSVSGEPFLEVWENGRWIILDNISSLSRMAKLDDLYTYIREMDWGVGNRLFIDSSGDLCMSLENQDTPLTTITSGIKLRELLMYEDQEKFDNIIMNKEIDFYYDYLVSTRDLLEKSSVLDLVNYPTEYTNILNLHELVKKNEIKKAEGIISLTIGYVKSGLRKTQELKFTPWEVTDDMISWLDYTESILGEVTVEFHDGCIRLFPETSEVTECIIRNCNLTYEQLV